MLRGFLCRHSCHFRRLGFACLVMKPIEIISLCLRFVRFCTPRITKVRLILLAFVLIIGHLSYSARDLVAQIQGAKLETYLMCSSQARNNAGYNDTSRGARITRIVHQTWKNESIPKVAVNWIKKWQKTNPDWEYWFWTDKDVEIFFQKKYPQFLNLYKNFPRSHAAIQRADMMRYFILYEYGGVYADLDLEPMKSLNPISDRYPCIFSEEPEEHSKILRPKYLNEYGALVCNAFIACRPGHPFLKYILDHLEESFNKTLKTKSVMYSTGPAMVSVLHAEYIKSRPDLCHNERDRAIVADSKYFMGIYDGSQTPKLAHMCATKENLPEFRSKACERLIRRMFQNRPGKDTYTVHHWFHTWTPKGQKYLPQKGHPAIHIKEVLPKAKLVGDMFGFQ